MTIFHIGYKGREVFPSDILAQEFGDRATIMGSVDTKIMILPNPKKVYDQAKEQLIKGRDSKCGYILGTACELPPDALPSERPCLGPGRQGPWDLWFMVRSLFFSSKGPDGGSVLSSPLSSQAR